MPKISLKSCADISLFDSSLFSIFNLSAHCSYLWNENKRAG